jgi:hypothetical protein
MSEKIFKEMCWQAEHIIPGTYSIQKSVFTIGSILGCGLMYILNFVL